MGVLICILEPDPLTLRLTAEMLESEGFGTLPLSEAAGALAVIRERRPALVVLETHLEGEDAGWTLLEMIRAYDETRDIPIIVCTSDATGVQKRSALLSQQPDTSVLIKPFDPQALVVKIRSTLAYEAS